MTTAHPSNTYDGATWPFIVWQDDESVPASIRRRVRPDAVDTAPSDILATAERVYGTTSPSLVALAAAETWQEVLSLPADPTQRLPRIMASGRHLPRKYAPVDERPNKGSITWTVEGTMPESVGRCTHRYYVAGEPVDVPNTGSTTTLAHDGSPLTATGRSSKRARGAAARLARDLLAAEAAGEQLVTDAPTVAPRYVMVDGEAVDVFNSDGSIG